MPYIVISTLNEMPPADAVPTPPEEALVNFYVALGGTTSAWQLVEFDLAQIFQATLASPHFRAAAAVFHAVVNARTRIDMIDAAFAERFAGEDIAVRWKKLSERTARMAQRRNKTAHWTMYFDLAETRLRKMLFLGPAVSNPKIEIVELKRTNQVHYDTDLADLTAEIQALHSELIMFSFEINGAPLDSSKSSQ